MTISDLLVRYGTHLEANDYSPRSIRTYAKVLNALDRALPHGALSTTDEIKAWLRRRNLKPNSRVTYEKAVKGFFHWATEIAGVVDFNPAADIEYSRVPRGLPRVITDEQLRRILNEASQPYRLWAILAAYAGLRCIEIHRLRREDITEQLVIVREGKGGHAGAVPTHPDLWAAVKDLPPGPIAADAVDEGAVSARFRRHCERKLGMRDVSLHRLRGWHATTSYVATKDIQAVQHNMRHSNIATTARYIALADQQKRDAVMALPRFAVDGDPPGPPAAPR